MFLMQMANLIMDPNGDKVLSKSGPGASGSEQISNYVQPQKAMPGYSSDQLNENATLKQRVFELEDKLMKVCLCAS